AHIVHSWTGGCAVRAGQQHDGALRSIRRWLSVAWECLVSMLPDRTDWDEQLDQFGQLAHESQNLGNADNWVFVFRAGVRGLTSRCNGIVWHSELFHAWIPVAPLEGREHHIAAMLFCMDSAMECLVFALNALGQA